MTKKRGTVSVAAPFKSYLDMYQPFGTNEEALAKFFRAQGAPQHGVKRFVPVLFNTIERAEGENTHRFVISTPDEDRDSDILVSDGAVLDHYLQNPVVLFAHDYYGLPIGRSIAMRKSTTNLTATVEWAPTDFAQQVRLLVDTGFLKGSSVGFNPIAWEQRQDQAKVDMWGFAYPGYKFNEWELLEWSVVAVPCNPYALLESAKSKGMRVDEIERMMRANSPRTSVVVPELRKVATQRDEQGNCYDADGNVVACPENHETLPLRTVVPLKVGVPAVSKPFGDYADFGDCVSQNGDKDDPEAFCAWLEHEITGEWPSQESLDAAKVIRAAAQAKVPDVKVNIVFDATTNKEKLLALRDAVDKILALDTKTAPPLTAPQPPGEHIQAEPIVLRVVPTAAPQAKATDEPPAWLMKALAEMLPGIVKQAIRQQVLGKVD